ncbi:transcriptional regulator [Pseudorhizobium endolithicum]|uniref:Transcriptional regulator n=1 Tax=Pseudorhizobium endolithicum TaxID=1191678 RepID=A0ABN7JSC7_9HYPH|nr:Hpt domain-containing protein [Pseudorhizobium endolithicum]CAD7045403.1 transcriptional regulator [Pseudorhizobium endolithicum]
MAVPAIAFEVPVSDRAACPSHSRPIDLVHLAGQTMGDRCLEDEILQIFARQARRALQEMGGADQATVRAAAHRLRGAANSVGAFTVADAAMRIEEKGADALLFSKLSAAVVEAENFILKLSR